MKKYIGLLILCLAINFGGLSGMPQKPVVPTEVVPTEEEFTDFMTRLRNESNNNAEKYTYEKIARALINYAAGNVNVIGRDGMLKEACVAQVLTSLEAFTKPENEKNASNADENEYIKDFFEKSNFLKKDTSDDRLIKKIMGMVGVIRKTVFLRGITNEVRVKIAGPISQFTVEAAKELSKNAKKIAQQIIYNATAKSEVQANQENKVFNGKVRKILDLRENKPTMSDVASALDSRSRLNPMRFISASSLAQTDRDALKTVLNEVRTKQEYLNKENLDKNIGDVLDGKTVSDTKPVFWNKGKLLGLGALAGLTGAGLYALLKPKTTDSKKQSEGQNELVKAVNEIQEEVKNQQNKVEQVEKVINGNNVNEETISEPSGNSSSGNMRRNLTIGGAVVVCGATLLGLYALLKNRQNGAIEPGSSNKFGPSLSYAYAENRFPEYFQDSSENLGMCSYGDLLAKTKEFEEARIKKIEEDRLKEEVKKKQEEENKKKQEDARIKKQEEDKAEEVKKKQEEENKKKQEEENKKKQEEEVKECLELEKECKKEEELLDALEAKQNETESALDGKKCPNKDESLLFARSGKDGKCSKTHNAKRAEALKQRGENLKTRGKKCTKYLEARKQEELKKKEEVTNFLNKVNKDNYFRTANLVLSKEIGKSDGSDAQLLLNQIEEKCKDKWVKLGYYGWVCDDLVMMKKNQK
ncbi:MAG: hypothetical protein ABH827_04355 [bacterium]